MAPSYERLILQTIKENNKSYNSYLSNFGIPLDVVKYNIKPLYEYPILESHKSYINCPNAEHILNTMPTVPIHQSLSKDTLIEIINEF